MKIYNVEFVVSKLLDQAKKDKEKAIAEEKFEAAKEIVEQIKDIEAHLADAQHALDVHQVHY